MRITDCITIDLPRIFDTRGNLTFLENKVHLPFEMKRIFYIYDVPSGRGRGNHAHKECHQFLICIKGSCSVVVDDGDQTKQFILNKPDMGLYLPPLIWGKQENYSEDACLLVLASHPFDEKDYIGNYENFLELKRAYSNLQLKCENC